MSDFQFTDVPFDDSSLIPTEYTCDGEDVSPPLGWAVPPADAETLALIVDDPDAPGPGAFTHWVLFNLPGSLTELPRAYSAGDPRVDTTGVQPGEALNDFGGVGYAGPCPPAGERHRYVFTLYALDAELDLESSTDPERVVTAFEGQVLDTAEHVGLYQRG